MDGNLKSELWSNPKFGNELEALFLRLKAKGFMRIEIPWLIKDLFYITGRGEHCTMPAIDQELEEMGWGIGVLDTVTYKLITSLAANNGLHDDEPLGTEGIFV